MHDNCSRFPSPWFSSFLRVNLVGTLKCMFAHKQIMQCTKIYLFTKIMLLHYGVFKDRHI